MATHSSILLWEILWTEELGQLQPMGSQESDTTQQINHYNDQSRGQFSFFLSLKMTTRVHQIDNLSSVVLIALYYEFRKFKSVSLITFSWGFQITVHFIRTSTKTSLLCFKTCSFEPSQPQVVYKGKEGESSPSMKECRCIHVPIFTTPF